MKKIMLILLLSSPIIALYGMDNNNNSTPPKIIEVCPYPFDASTSKPYFLPYTPTTTIGDLKNYLQHLEGINPSMHALRVLTTDMIILKKSGPLPNRQTVQEVVNTYNPIYLELFLQLPPAPGK